MSIEAKYLANKINQFLLDSETSSDDIVYEKGLNDFDSIKRDISFVNPRGLNLTIDLLTENGKLVYKKYFEKYFDREKIKQISTKYK